MESDHWILIRIQTNDQNQAIVNIHFDKKDLPQSRLDLEIGNLGELFKGLVSTLYLFECRPEKKMHTIFKSEDDIYQKIDENSRIVLGSTAQMANANSDNLPDFLNLIFKRSKLFRKKDSNDKILLDLYSSTGYGSIIGSRQYKFCVNINRTIDEAIEAQASIGSNPIENVKYVFMVFSYDPFSIYLIFISESNLRVWIVCWECIWKNLKWMRITSMF